MPIPPASSGRSISKPPITVPRGITVGGLLSSLALELIDQRDFASAEISSRHSSHASM
jgi:hypothetical protein